MNHDTRAPASTARRRLLAGLAGIAASSALPASRAATASTPGTAAPDALARAVAGKARTLAGPDPKPLRLLIPNGCGANLAPVVEAFESLSGVAVELLDVPVDEVGTRLLVDALSGSADYDLALPPTFALPDLVAAEAIKPLSALAARHEPEDFRAGVLYDAGDRFDDDLYGFQTDGDAYLMFYHRDLLQDETERKRYADRYGAALEVPLTWEELDRQMAFFHRPDDGLAGGLLFRTSGYLAWEWWVRFHAKGVWPLSPTLVPQMDGDAGVEALEEMIRATAHLVPAAGSLGLFENWERFERGDVFCNIGWGGTQKYLHRRGSHMRDRLVHGPTPGGVVDGRRLAIPYFNWGWEYVVVTPCTRAELAYLFALFAASPTMSTLSVSQIEGFFDPFRAEHYADERIRDAYGEEFLSVHRASLGTAMPDLYLAHHGDYFHALGLWLERAIAGRVDPAVALHNVALAWDAIVPRAGHERQVERWLALRAHYPAELAEQMRDLG